MLDLSPLFQRGLVWNIKQKSELIESIIMGIPIPVFYVKERPDGVYVVVDGKQRLSTLFDFINNKFALGNLSILAQYKGLRFNDLSSLDQNKIEDYTLTINVIKAPTSDRVTFDLFDRVNRGGTRITNQEMRNALYQGNATQLIDKLAELPDFIEVTEKGASTKHMKDRLVVLRFIAFYLWQEQLTKDTSTGMPLEYRSNIEDFLGKTMTFLNSLSPDHPLLEQLESVFINTIINARDYILPLGGFRLQNKDKQKRQLNMSFFESFCYLISKHKFTTQDEAKKVYDTLLSNPDYRRSITFSIDSSTQINIRYREIRNILKELSSAE